MAEKAFLGTALLDISGQNEKTRLIFGTFNPGRQEHKSVLDEMVKMLLQGECHSADNPLVMAVRGNDIVACSLTKEAQPGSLKTAQFLQHGGRAAPLEVLAGMHRIKAVQRASKVLNDRLSKLEADLDEAGQDRSEDEEGLPRGQDEEFVAAIQGNIEVTEQVIGLFKTWPVRFYDIGSFQPAMASPQVLTAFRYASGPAPNAPL